MAQQEGSDSDGPIIDDNIIRIQLRKPSHRKWELRTRNLSPGIKFPTIQLFDCEGNLLLETNDDNISIKSSQGDQCGLKTSHSLQEKDFRHNINKNAIRKNKSICGGKIFTRLYRVPSKNEDNFISRYIIKDSNGVCNIPKQKLLNNYLTSIDISRHNSLQPSEPTSEFSSCKSSDIESFSKNSESVFDESLLISNEHETSPVQKSICYSQSSISVNDISDCVIEDYTCDKNVNTLYECGTNNNTEVNVINLKKSKSFNNFEYPLNNKISGEYLSRSKSGTLYKPPQNKISFLNTYLKSLPVRTTSNPNWFSLSRHNSDLLQKPPPRLKLRDPPKLPPENTWRFCNVWDNTSENDSLNIPTDVAVAHEMRKRLKMYRRGISEVENRQRKVNFFAIHRRYSASDLSRHGNIGNTSSSESIDEADVVLNRLRRRILRNKVRAKRFSEGALNSRKRRLESISNQSSGDERRDDSERSAVRAALVRRRYAMGSNISQHSSKGLKGRRARSSGDLCNGDTKSQTESSVCGSVVGEVMGWNRSLPNHLDGNRHLADYSRVNNNYAEFGTYNRCHPKGGRGLRYRVFKSGSDLDPVWKLQDPGCDQGYGSERSPEEDCVPPIQPTLSLEEYEEQLRAMYPFINDENSFTVVVEKDGRGLGMSVCGGGGGGLVRIRRLYPPQPAWRTGRLAPKDLLLSANGVPLAGLSTYEALEVLRTAASRVELRVCRPPPGAFESVTPPDPPTPPARTPHPPLPPPDPLNCHPMHARLSQTTSSATTSSSEGRGRREASPEVERRDLRLPDLDRNLPVYDMHYGEFDIIMSKVNGSLGFTLRKEDHSALGHYVRALVREPALSDGRIQPGDRIVAVNDTPMSNMSHAEAVAFLRACGSEVRLRLYRDHAATPLSPTSPREEGPTDSDVPASRPKPPLRPEAVSMLCDLAARRLTPDPAVDGARSPGLSPRKFRKLTKDAHHYDHNDESKHIDCPKIETETGCDKGRHRTQSLTQDSPTSTNRKQKLSLTVPPHGYELNNLDNDTLDAPNIYQEDSRRYLSPAYPVDSDEPVSMPVELLSDENRFCHSNPTYQSAVIHTTSSEATSSDGYKEDVKTLKKWKGVTLSPENERKTKPPPPPPILTKVEDLEQKENIEPGHQKIETSNEPTIMTVELNRGWNSRLGFSVQSHPESGQSYISAVYNDSVAARDGRLRRGDVILQVNDENVTSMKTPEVIDLLRILRGSICITVLRPPTSQ